MTEKFKDAASVYDRCFEMAQDLAEEMYYKSEQYAKTQTVENAIDECRKHINFLLNELNGEEDKPKDPHGAAAYAYAAKVSRELVETMETNSMVTTEPHMLAKSRAIGFLKDAIHQMEQYH